MASSSSDRGRPDVSDHHTNPFVAFRRFADAQMSSMMNGVFGIFESSPVRRQRAIDEYEAMLRRSREMNRDQWRSESTFDHDAEEPERYDQSDKDLVVRVKAYNSTSPPGDGGNPDDEDFYVDCEYDRLHGGLSIPCCRFSKENTGLKDLMPWMPVFGITYMYTSPYSPVHLEQEDEFKMHSGKLRAAFADLLAYQEDQALLSNNTAQTNSQMTPSEWLADMTGLIIFGRGGRRYEWDQFDALHFHKLMVAAEFRDRIVAERYRDTPCYMHFSALVDTYSRLDFCNLAGRALGMEQGPEVSERAEDERPSTMSQKFASIWNTSREDSEKDIRHEDSQQWKVKESEEQQYATGDDDDDDDDDFEDDDEDEDEDDDKTPTSELDLYRALRRALTEPKDNPRCRVELHVQAKGDVKPSVLSTLTTTEQRTLPDGSVSTRVILKKKFSDGVEEVTENVHTQNGSQPPKPVLAESVKNQDLAPKRTNDEKRKGWFWS